MQMRHFVSIMKLDNHYNNIVENKELRGCYGIADARATPELQASRKMAKLHLFAWVTHAFREFTVLFR